MKKILIIIIFFITVGIFLPASVKAATRTWDGGGGADPNWSNNLNWSNDTTPVAGDDVVFDNTSSNNSTWDTSGPASIGSLTVNSNYSGTLTLGRDVSISGNLTYNGANFAHGNHKISFTGGGGTWTTGSVTYYDIEVNLNAGNNLTITGTGTIARNLTLTGSSTSQMYTGTLNVGGDITLTNFKGGSALININGTGNQTITGSGTDCVGQLPYVTINKASGNLTLSGNISVRNDWTFTSVGSGSLITTGSTLTFCDTGSSGGGGFNVSGVQTLNNVTFVNNNTYTNGWTIGNTNITVAGNLAFKGTGFIRLLSGGGSAVLIAQKDITITNTAVFPSGVSSGGAVVRIAGTGDQTLTGSGTEGQGTLPAVTINKASGNLTLSSIITVGNSWTFTSIGSGSLITTSSTVAFYDSNGSGYSISGTHTLNNVTFTNNNTYVSASGFSMAASSILTVNGTLSIKGTSYVRLGASSGGSIYAKGDIIVTNTSTVPAGETQGNATSIITVNGTVDQTLTGSGTECGGTLPSFTINKASGNLTLSGLISIAATWTFTSVGSGSLVTTSSTVAFCDNNGSGDTIVGTQTLNNVTFVNNNTFVSNFLLSGTMTITVNGTLKIGGTQYVRIANGGGTGNFAAKGDITVTNTSTIVAGQTSGNAVINITGTTDQVLTGSGVDCGGTLPPVTINKASGNLTLSSTISEANTWTFTSMGSGSLITTSSTVAFCNNDVASFNIVGSQTLNNVTFVNNSVSTGTTFIINNTVTVSGTLSFKGTTYLRIGNNGGAGTISAQGDITITNTGVMTAGQTAVAVVININGTGSQVFTGSGTDCQGKLGPITINKASGNLTLASIISVGGNWTFTSVGTGSLITTGSTVSFCDNNGSGYTIAGTHTLNNVTFVNNNTWVTGYTIGTSNTLTVSGTLAFKGSNYLRMSGNGSNIYAKGDITVTNTATIPAGQTQGAGAPITINGTTDQVFTGSGVESQGPMPPIVINKASGNLTLASIITISCNGSPCWTFTSTGTGSLITTGSTVAFYDSNGSGYTISGTQTLNNVTFANNNTFVSGFTIGTGTLTVAGTLAIKGTNYTRLTGNGPSSSFINAQGDITITNTTGLPATASVGGLTITINGTGNQIFTGSGVEGAGAITAAITINKASGNLTLSSIITTIGAWTYTSIGGGGSLITTSSTVAFYDSNGSGYSITGTHTLNNITFANNNTYAGAFSVPTGTDLTVSGTLSIKGTTFVRLTGGSNHLYAQGDITVTNTATIPGGQTQSGFPITINGTGNQVITGSGVGGQGVLPGVTINKASGNLTLSGVISATGNWQFTSIGTGQIISTGSTLWFDPSTDAWTFSPGTSITYNNITVSPSSTGSITLASTSLTLSGTLTESGNASSSFSTSGSNIPITTGNISITAGTFNANGSTITISGNYTNSATFTKGTSTLVFNGSGSSTIEPGTSQINNFTVTTASKSLKFSITNSTVITGILTLNGADCNTQIGLDSTNGSSQFTINATGTKTVSYVNVKNSIATTAITTSSSWDSGNNSGWTITNNTCTGLSASSTGYSFQRKTWYDGSRLWKSFNANTEIEFWYSTDGGINWTENTTARIAVDTNDFSIEANSTNAYIVYTSSNDIKGRAASSYPGTGFGWGSEQTVLNGSGVTDDYSYPVITKDSSSYVWVGARYTGSSVYYFKTIKHPGATNTLPQDSGDTVYSISNTTNSNSNVYGTLVSTGSQNMYAIFANNTALQGCKWTNISSNWIDSSGNSCGVSWYDPSWPYRVKLTIDHTKVTADQTDFPVYVDLANMPAGFHSHVNQTDARDIRVTKSDGTTELPREVVSYNSSNDTGELHFKYSGTLSSSAYTNVYIYYGNPSASDYAASDTYGKNNVWTNGYQGIWHLNEASGGTGAIKDATSNTNIGTDSGSPTFGSSGKIGSAVTFDAINDKINVPDTNNSLDMSGSFTISAWIKRTTYSGYKFIVVKQPSGTAGSNYSGNYEWRVNGATMELLYQNTTSTSYSTHTATSNLTNNTLQYATVVFNPGDKVYFYINGAPAGSSNQTSAYGILNDNDVIIGSRKDNYSYFDGLIDEVRISNNARSSTWVSTEYNNQNSAATFFNSWGSEEPYSIATISTGLTNNISSVADSSGNVHLVYIDSSGHTVYQEYNGSWQTAVTLDSNSGNSYSTISTNTVNDDLYALWIRGNHIYYKKGVSPYASGNWDVSATDWKTTGTNTYVTSNYSGSARIFAEWTIGSSPPYTIGWDDITYVSNQAPNAPTTLYVNEEAAGAQSGVSNPVGVGDGTPAFSAIYNDSDIGDVASKYEIVTYSDAGCSSQVWDSGSSGTTIANCTQGNRCSDITYGGTTLPLDGSKYYWKINYFDSAGASGAFSSCSDNFTILGPGDQMRHGSYFFNSQTKRVYTW